MNKKNILMYGSLLHDIGKIIYRSGDHTFSRRSEERV